MNAEARKCMRFTKRDLVLLDLVMRELLYLCEEGRIQDLLAECDMDLEDMPTGKEVATLLDQIRGETPDGHR